MKRHTNMSKKAADEGIVVHCPECDAEVLTIDLLGMEIGIDDAALGESEEESPKEEVEEPMDKKSYIKNIIAKLDKAAEAIEDTNPELAKRIDMVSNELETRLEDLE